MLIDEAQPPNPPPGWRAYRISEMTDRNPCADFTAVQRAIKLETGWTTVWDEVVVGDDVPEHLANPDWCGVCGEPQPCSGEREIRDLAEERR